MGVKREAGVKNLTKWVTSLIDGPLDQIIKCVRVSKHHQIKIHENVLFSMVVDFKIFYQNTRII